MYEIGDKIRIISMDDKWSGNDYAGKEGIIEYIGIDPWGDMFLRGTWGGLSVYPKIDRIIKLEAL